jgi:hypothetical protein
MQDMYNNGVTTSCIMYTYTVTKSWPVTAPGSQGVFRGRGRGFGFLKKWAPGSYCLELVVACPAAGTSAQILLVEGK